MTSKKASRQREENILLQVSYSGCSFKPLPYRRSTPPVLFTYERPVATYGLFLGIETNSYIDIWANALAKASKAIKADLEFTRISSSDNKEDANASR